MYHVQTTTDKDWQTYESFETKEEAIAHKKEWEDEFPEVNIRIVNEDLMDKVVKWLENEVCDGAEIVAEYENEDHPDGQRPKCTDGTDDIIYGRAECAESLLNQIKKWSEE